MVSIIADQPRRTRGLVATLIRPTPVYRQIADHYEIEIASGRLEAGDRIPPITELVQTWQVSPGTAHKAVRDLVARGLAATARTGTTVQQRGVGR